MFFNIIMEVCVKVKNGRRTRRKGYRTKKSLFNGHIGAIRFLNEPWIHRLFKVPNEKVILTKR